MIVWLTREQTPSARAFKGGGSSVIPTVCPCPGLPSPDRHSLAAMCPWPGPGWPKQGTWARASLALSRGGRAAAWRGLSRGRRVWRGRGDPDLPAFHPPQCSCARVSWSGVGPGRRSGGGTQKTPCGQGNLGRGRPGARPVSLACSQSPQQPLVPRQSHLKGKRLRGEESPRSRSPRERRVERKEAGATDRRREDNRAAPCWDGRD